MSANRSNRQHDGSHWSEAWSRNVLRALIDARSEWRRVFVGTGRSERVAKKVGLHFAGLGVTGLIALVWLALLILACVPLAEGQTWKRPDLKAMADFGTAVTVVGFLFAALALRQTTAALRLQQTAANESASLSRKALEVQYRASYSEALKLFAADVEQWAESRRTYLEELKTTFEGLGVDQHGGRSVVELTQQDHGNGFSAPVALRELRLLAQSVRKTAVTVLLGEHFNLDSLHGLHPKYERLRSVVTLAISLLQTHGYRLDSAPKEDN